MSSQDHGESYDENLGATNMNIWALHGRWVLVLELSGLLGAESSC